MRLPGREIPSAVEDRQHLDTIGEHDEGDEIAGLLQPCDTHILPNLAMQLWHLLDACKHPSEHGQGPEIRGQHEPPQADHGLPGHRPLLHAAGLPAGSQTTFEPLQHVPPRPSDAGGFRGTSAAFGVLRNVPIRNIPGLDLIWQAVPDPLIEIETISRAQAIDTQSIDANGHA